MKLAGRCDYWSCLPPITGTTYPGGPTHTVHSPGRDPVFSCCKPDTFWGSNASVVAWFGGPKGSALRLQRWYAKAKFAKGWPGRWANVATVAAPPANSTAPTKVGSLLTDC